MGHVGQVRHDRSSRYVAAERNLERMSCIARFFARQHIAERHELPLTIRHFYPDGGLSRNRRKDSHIGGRHRVGDVFRQARHPRHLHARTELELIAGHGRADGMANEPRVHAMSSERVDEGATCDRYLSPVDRTCA